MNDMEEVFQTLSIGLVVATFLLNNGRALKAIQICKECLIYLSKEVLKTEAQLVNSIKIGIYQRMFEAYCLLPDYTNAIKYGRELLVMYRECGETVEEGNISIRLANIFERQCKYAEARELYKRAINIMEEIGNRKSEVYAYVQFGIMSFHLGDYAKAKANFGKALAITIDIGDKAGEAAVYGNLGTVFRSLGEYDKAKEYHEKALAIRIEIGDRAGEAADNGNLGTVFNSIGEYDKAIEYHEKALAIRIEIGDRVGEAADYGNLGTVFRSLAQYDKAKKYLEKALRIGIEIGDRAREATDYGNLGTVFFSLGEYDKAKEYLEKALAISIEIGDKAGEASCYGNLGTVFRSLGQYDKAKEYHENALVIRTEIGDRAGEAADNGNLGTIFSSLGEYDKAKEYYEKALAIRIEIGDRVGEATQYGKLGAVFRSLGEYEKAKEYHEKALVIRVESGDRAGEAEDFGNLGTVFSFLGEYEKAKEYHEKALAITIEIGDKGGEAADYRNLGMVFRSLGKYDKAKEYYERALAIRIEIGDRDGEGSCYRNLGVVFERLGEYEKAKEFYKKSLTITVEIGDRVGEAANYGNLGSLFHCLGKHVMAEGYLEKAILILQDTGNADLEFQCYGRLALVKLSQGKIQEALHCLVLSINKSENLRSFLGDNDQFKIAFSDVHDFPYRKLSSFFCYSGNTHNALCVLELARARALADLMATQYSVKRQVSANPLSWIGIENILKKESNCACIYIFCYAEDVFLWILKTSGVIYFRRITVNENIIGTRLVSTLEDFLAKRFRSLGILSKQDCEDRSLHGIESETKFSQEEKVADFRLVEETDDDIRDPEPSLPLLYKMIVVPVADLLEEPEIIIVPDPFLYQVPFAALTDESGRYLSEFFRIRIVPSLATLKLIQDSPADYHNQTGALIVGDPVVGRVRYKRCRKTFLPLPCAREEAEMIGELLGVHPLLGEYATKQAVLERINSVSLIHFAAHGSAERGEIALTPVCTRNTIPHEEDYLLTMSDISKFQLRAKLVVLSCCHSGCGQIRAEGVVGIARAFLGSGARSVLVALWAIQDKATEQFMRHFYEHLVRGESASESLHETMKWMRGNGFTKVCEWAPFMLIGDNVTFDVEKLK